MELRRDARANNTNSQGIESKPVSDADRADTYRVLDNVFMNSCSGFGAGQRGRTRFACRSQVQEVSRCDCKCILQALYKASMRSYEAQVRSLTFAVK